MRLVAIEPGQREGASFSLAVQAEDDGCWMGALGGKLVRLASEMLTDGDGKRKVPSEMRDSERLGFETPRSAERFVRVCFGRLAMAGSAK